jgi:hypothetical protein
VRRQLRLAALTLALTGCLGRSDTPKGWRLEQPEVTRARARLTPSATRARTRVFLQTSPPARDAGPAASSCTIRIRGAALWTNERPTNSSDPPTVIRIAARPLTSRGPSPWDVSSRTAVALRPDQATNIELAFDWDLAHGCAAGGACTWAFELEFEWFHAERGALEITWQIDTLLYGAHWRDLAAPAGVSVSRVEPPARP